MGYTPSPSNSECIQLKYSDVMYTKCCFTVVAGFDYVPVSLVLMFGPSYPSEQCLVIEIIDDSLAEELEQFYVVLSSSSEAINITDREFNIIIEPNNCESHFQCLYPAI